MKKVTLGRYCPACQYRFDVHPPRPLRCPQCNSSTKKSVARVEIDQRDISQGVASE